METKRMITCFCGFRFPEDASFCPECGTLRADIPDHVQADQNPLSAVQANPGIAVGQFGMPGVYAAPGVCISPADTEEPASNPPDDKDLKLLIDCCKKTLATGCGDSCDETVLYLDENTNEYQIHTYRRDFGSFKEVHRGYKADKEVYDKTMETIINSGLPEYDGRVGSPMCGGEYVCKFLYEDRVIRLTSSNAPQGDLYAVGSLLNSFIRKENEIFGKSEVDKKE